MCVWATPVSNQVDSRVWANVWPVAVLFAALSSRARRTIVMLLRGLPLAVLLVAHGSGLSFSRFGASPRTKRVLRSRPGVTMSSNAERAVAGFDMIEENEKKARKVVGAATGVLTLAAHGGGYLSYSGLGGGLAGALITYRTGAESQ